MSDRIKGLVVTFERDLDDEHVERITDAFKLLKGVVSVKPLVSDMDQLIADERARTELRRKIMDLLA